jgi:hypothetical protein
MAPGTRPYPGRTWGPGPGPEPGPRGPEPGRAGRAGAGPAGPGPGRPGRPGRAGRARIRGRAAGKIPVIGGPAGPRKRRQNRPLMLVKWQVWDPRTGRPAQANCWNRGSPAGARPDTKNIIPFAPGIANRTFSTFFGPRWEIQGRSRVQRVWFTLEVRFAAGSGGNSGARTGGHSRSGKRHWLEIPPPLLYWPPGGGGR